MTNSAKIRTMQDDIDEAKKNLEEQTKQRQKPQVSDTAEESIKKQLLQLKSIKPDQSGLRQAADLRAQQLEKNSAISPEKDRKPIFIPPEKPAARFSKKINSAKDNELKNLIKRISNETDEDPDDDKDLTKKENDKKEILQAEKNNAAEDKIANENKGETKEIIEDELQKISNDLAKKSDTGGKDERKEFAQKSREEMEALKKDLDKMGIEEKTREEDIASKHIKELEESEKNAMEVLKRNAKEIEDLKKMISRISESSNIKKMTGTKTDNAGETKKNIQENDGVKPLARQYEQNTRQNARPTEDQKIENEPALALPDKNENKSFWKNVLEQIKKTSESKKINDLKNENLISKTRTDKSEEFEKYSEQSGILRNDDQQQEEELIGKSLSEEAYDENYTPPAERLAWGKQEFYSSVIKKIKPREEKGEIESLKNAAMIKNRQILSKDEEYKKLKHSIAKKYHINLFALPWKKIISIAVIAIALAGIVSYFVFSEINPFAPPIAPPAVIGGEIEKFSGMEKEIIISKKNLQGFNNLELEALNIFNTENNIKIIKLLVVNNEEEKNILSLSEALDSIGIINIKGNINYLPDGFLQAAADNYNIFIFRTGRGTIRYGLAIKAKNKDSLFGIMRNWEKEEARSKKMSAVFKPLFVNDKNFEETFNSFSASFYKNIEIRYVHLVNKDTALNYFFYEDILVFTTSKDTASTTIDFLIPSN